MTALVYHRSLTDEWETPPELFDVLNSEFRFTVDAAASPANAKLPRFWTIEDDGLAQDWSGQTVWCNPPYSQAAKWLEKAATEAQRGATVVMLTGSRTGTRYWGEWVWPHAREIRFLTGRLKFLSDGKPADSCPFDLAIIVYRSGAGLAVPAVFQWDWRPAARGALL